MPLVRSGVKIGGWVKDKIKKGTSCGNVGHFAEMLIIGPVFGFPKSRALAIPWHICKFFPKIRK